MKNYIKYTIFIFFSVIIIVAGIVFWGMHLMAEEDKYVDIEYAKSEFENGDIIFQTSKSKQSKAIQIATKSKYSHMGIIYIQDSNYFVLEAVQPVKLTLLNDWIKRGDKEHYVVKRLKKSDAILTITTIEKMKDVSKRYLGKNYDIYFEWSDEKIYCSELVWKIYKEAVGIEIGKLEKLKSFDLSNKIVKKILEERYGDAIPLDETVISPVSIYNDDKLETVMKYE